VIQQFYKYGVWSLKDVLKGVKNGSWPLASRGVFGGGITSSSYTNVVDYVTIQTTGNATDFGDLTAARNELAACSDATRGVFGGGYLGSYTNVLDYVTIQTAGNATDFGDLTVVRSFLAACSA